MEQNVRTVCGEVVDVFAYRFVVSTTDGKVLADLGTKGAQRVMLNVGDQVEVTGETKPSELKVSRITQLGREPVDIHHEPKKDGHEKHEKQAGDADPGVALRASSRTASRSSGSPDASTGTSRSPAATPPATWSSSTWSSTARSGRGSL